MKRFLSIGLWIICLLSVCCLSALAAPKVIGQVVSTDIRAYINGEEIPAYNIDGNMVVVGGDLRAYGFSVVYDNTTRTSSVEYTDGPFYCISDITHYSSVGVKVMDVYETDIKVLVNGKQVQAYNVDNKMAFKFSELKVFGDYHYDNTARASYLEVGLQMTREECERAISVHYLSDRSIEHDDAHNQFKLFFSLQDSNGKRLSVPAYVDVRIKNKGNEIVYDKKHIVKSSDFGLWTSALKGERLLCCIYINDADIDKGMADSGTIYFTIYNHYFSFDESDLTIYGDLPVKGSAVILPPLPQTIVSEDIFGGVDSIVKVTAIRTEMRGDSLYIYFSGEKTYDKEGKSHSGYCKIGWKLYDMDGYVVDSGTYYSPQIKVGEKFKDGEEIVWRGVTPGRIYRLEVLSTEY